MKASLTSFIKESHGVQARLSVALIKSQNCHRPSTHLQVWLQSKLQWYVELHYLAPSRYQDLVKTDTGTHTCVLYILCVVSVVLCLEDLAIEFRLPLNPYSCCIIIQSASTARVYYHAEVKAAYLYL